MELTWEILLIIFFLGILFGVIGSMAGIGGGVFYVSFLTLFFGIAIQEAIDTSNFVILIMAGSGFIIYLRDKRCNLKIVLAFSAISILGSLTCAIIFFYASLEEFVLKILFGFVLISSGIYMIYNARRSKKRTSTEESAEKCVDLKNFNYKEKIVKAAPLFFIGGFLSQLLGIGGGIINVPTLNIVVGFPIHNATAVSTGVIFFTAIFNVLSKAVTGHINWVIGIILGVGSLTGSIIGAKLSNKVPKYYLQLFVAVVLIGLALNMIIRA